MAVVFCCLTARVMGCDFGVADGWGVVVPEKVEWRNVPLSNVVVAINGFLARYTTNNPPYTLQVVRERGGKSEIVPVGSPLLSNMPITFTGQYIGIGCMVKIIASVSGQFTPQSTKHGPVWVIVENEEEQLVGITNEFRGRVEPRR